jgi:hypothetical protein
LVNVRFGNAFSTRYGAGGLGEPVRREIVHGTRSALEACGANATSMRINERPEVWRERNSNMMVTARKVPDPAVEINARCLSASWRCVVLLLCRLAGGSGGGAAGLLELPTERRAVHRRVEDIGED